MGQQGTATRRDMPGTLVSIKSGRWRRGVRWAPSAAPPDDGTPIYHQSPVVPAHTNGSRLESRPIARVTADVDACCQSVRREAATGAETDTRRSGDAVHAGAREGHGTVRVHALAPTAAAVMATSTEPQRAAPSVPTRGWRTWKLVRSSPVGRRGWVHGTTLQVSPGGDEIVWRDVATDVATDAGLDRPCRSRCWHYPLRKVALQTGSRPRMPRRNVHWAPCVPPWRGCLYGSLWQRCFCSRQK